jgi:hypothetical protein
MCLKIKDVFSHLGEKPHPQATICVVTFASSRIMLSSVNSWTMANLREEAYKMMGDIRGFISQMSGEHDDGLGRETFFFWTMPLGQLPTMSLDNVNRQCTEGFWTDACSPLSHKRISYRISPSKPVYWKSAARRPEVGAEACKAIYYSSLSCW